MLPSANATASRRYHVTVQVRKNEDAGLYELGDEIDGVFVSFADKPIPAVDAAVQNAKDTEGDTPAAES